MKKLVLEAGDSGSTSDWNHSGTGIARSKQPMLLKWQSLQPQTFKPGDRPDLSRVSAPAMIFRRQ
ncbi:MAG: hypothetical protein AAGB13_16540 [Cyanobacteria bacterium P01_F01_bin.33]